MFKINLSEHNMFSVRVSTPTLGEYQFRDIVAKDLTDAYVIIMNRARFNNLNVTRDNVLEVATANGYTLTDITAECMPTHTIIGGKN